MKYAWDCKRCGAHGAEDSSSARNDARKAHRIVCQRELGKGRDGVLRRPVLDIHAFENREQAPK